MELSVELVRQFGRAELEDVLSGPGLVNLYHFTHTAPCAGVGEPARRSDMPALIPALTLQGRLMRSLLRLTCLVVFSFALAAPAWADETGSISGTVFDSTGEVVAGA